MNRFAGLLVLFIIASFPQILWGLRTFVVRDFGNFSYPLAHYLRECFWRGEIPLWNPLNDCGLPFLAQWNTQALYPPALFYLILPLSWSLGVFCLLHLFWGGLGMFLLARHWTQNHFAAAFAGVVFAFNGLMLNSVVWPATIAGLAWMPWVVWLVDRAWREGGKTLVLAVFAGALQMLSGAVEPIALTWILLGTLGLIEFIRGKIPRTKIALRAPLIVLLISGLSAAQLLPFLDLASHSNRQDALYQGSQWPMPVTGWFNFLAPLFHYQSSGDGYYLQIGQFWTISYYVGVVVVALAVWSVFRVKSFRVWALAVLTIMCLVLALGEGTPIYGWLCLHVKAISSMRFPIKFVVLPVFALPLLAAWGLAKRPPTGPRQWLLFWIVPVILTAVIIGIAHQYRVPNDDYHATLLNALFRLAFLTAIVTALFLLSRTPQPRPLQLLVLSLVWLDLYLHLPQPPTTVPATYSTPFERKVTLPAPGNSRAMIPGEALHTLIFASDPDATHNYLFQRFSLFSDCNR